MWKYADAATWEPSDLSSGSFWAESVYRCILHNSYTEYGDLSDKSQPWSQAFEHLVPNRWRCLGRLMRCGLAGWSVYVTGGGF